MKKSDFDIVVGDFVEVNKPSYKGLQNWKFSRDAHNYAHLDFYTTMGGEIIVDNIKYKEEPNTILCIPKNKAYKGTVKNEFHQYYSLLFSYETSSDSGDFPFPVLFKPKDPQYYLDKYKEAYKLSIIQPFGYKARIRKIIYDILTGIMTEHYSRLNNDNGGYTIRKSMEYIHSKFDKEDMNITEIAMLSGVSDTHFRRVFKKIYGISPSKYVNKLRLDKAGNLLADTNLSVEEIVYKCGYNNYSYFERVFKTVFGVTPSDYRKKHANTDYV